MIVSEDSFYNCEIEGSFQYKVDVETEICWGYNNLFFNNE